MNSVFLTASEEETERAGRALADALLASPDYAEHAFVALYGEMGVGKTAFARGFASALGIDSVSSPSFTVVNEYPGRPLPLFHFDLYRLGDEEELYTIGFEDYLVRKGYALCEWSERAPTLLPSQRISVRISRCPEARDCRKIEIQSSEEGNGENSCV